MKFGKSLRSEISAKLPQWEDEFISYKVLKQQLNLHTRDNDGFTRLLEIEIEKMNLFFVRKEEEYIIILKELKDKVADLDHTQGEDTLQVTKVLLEFHHEMVLLLHYNVLNYEGLIKIIKKHHKKTGTLLCSRFMQRALQQPIFTTDLLYNLLKQCEAILSELLHSTRGMDINPLLHGSGGSQPQFCTKL